MTPGIFFEQIAKQYESQLPFVIYRKPNRLGVRAVLQKDNSLHFTKSFKESGFVFSPFDDAEGSVLLPLNSSEVISVSDAALTVQVPDDSQGPLVSDLGKTFHVNLVRNGIDAIKSGTLQKVVLSRREEVALQNTNPIPIFKNLLALYASAFVYCWYHPKVGLWLGATPETLLKIEGARFSIMALAGTKNYKGSLDVVWNEKELQEQQFVTDFILDNIDQTVQSIKVSGLETVRAGNLLHLRTRINGNLNLNSLNLEKLLCRLHPTPAVCGLPKETAKQFILKHEHYHREFYTGFLGELNFESLKRPRTGQRNIENRAYAIRQKTTQLYVNLRCMQIKDNRAIVYVGGGITETSDPQSEWEETVSKSLVVKKVL